MINAKKYQIPKSQTQKMEKIMKGFDKGVGQYLNAGVQEKSGQEIDWLSGPQVTLWGIISSTFSWFILLSGFGAALLLCLGLVMSGIDFFLYKIGIETHICDYITNNFLEPMEKDPNLFVILICVFIYGSWPGMMIWTYFNQCRAKWRIWRNS